MAKRFIDKDKLIEHLEDNVRECGNPDVATEPITYGCSLGLKGALSYARTLPTADVVEVVRCKDCRHANDCGTICHYGVGKAVEPEHFCGYGARRKDDDKS